MSDAAEPSGTPALPETVTPAESGHSLPALPEAQPVVAGPPPAEAQAAEVAIVSPAEPSRHAFPCASLFSSSDLRKLRVRHEDFIRSLSAQLSIYLRLDFGLRMAKLEGRKFHDFLQALPNPAYLASFRLHPLPGKCRLEISPRLALAIVDRQLGGSGQCAEGPQEVTELEIRLLSRFVDIIIGEWCNFWRPVLDLRPELAETETNSRSVQHDSRNTTFLVLAIEAKLGEITEQIQLVFPYGVLKPLLDKLNATVQQSEQENAEVEKPSTSWNPALDELHLTLTAELPSVTLSAAQLAKLKPGDLLPFELSAASRVQVNIANRPKFLAVLGTIDDRKAIRLERRV